MKTRTWTVILVVLAAGLGALSFIALKGKDRTAPEIIVPDTQITYSEDMPEEELLKDVKAKDNKDGDISDKVFVDRVIKTPDNKTAMVYYAVVDKAQNVTKKERCIPVGDSAKEVVKKDSKSQAEDSKSQKKDKTSDKKENKEENKKDEDEQGIYPANPEEYGEGRPVIQVKEKRFKVKKGKSLNLMECIEHFYSPDGDNAENRSYMAAHTSIKVDGENVGMNYTPTEESEKKVTYSTVDKNGNYSVATEMILVVE